MTARTELRKTYQQLCETGKPLPGLNPRVSSLPNLSYIHSDGSTRRVFIENEALGAVGCVHAGEDVRAALSGKHIHAAPLEDAVDLIDRRFQEDNLIWGVSGFASGGFNYTIEAKALHTLYDYLVATERKPGLSVDGGTSEGSLGLNAVITEMHGIQTLGCVPLEGLSSVSRRPFVIAWGNAYKDREVLVSTIPDVLVCVGGSDSDKPGAGGSRRECQKALKNGSVVLLLALKNYGPDSLPQTYLQYEEMRTGLEEDRLFICSSEHELRTTIDLVWAKAQEPSHFRRPARLQKIKRLLLGA